MRCGCARCVDKARLPPLPERRARIATAEQVAEHFYHRYDDEWVPDYGEPDDSWMLDWHRPKENPWQVPPLHVVRAQMAFRQQCRADYQREPPSPLWALMAHAFTRRS